jgi:hypothetical protein
VFTARYALSPYLKQIRFVFKGLKCIAMCSLLLKNKYGRYAVCFVISVTNFLFQISSSHGSGYKYFWDMTPCILVGGYEIFGQTYCLLFRVKAARFQML